MTLFQTSLEALLSKMLTLQLLLQKLLEAQLISQTKPQEFKTLWPIWTSLSRLTLLGLQTFHSSLLVP